jgi:hypothetical protein
MPELAHVRRAGAHLALFVDDGVVVVGRGRVEGEDRPAVLHRKHRREVVLHEPRADL